mgnify:CR=1 FL=1
MGPLRTGVRGELMAHEADEDHGGHGGCSEDLAVGFVQEEPRLLVLVRRRDLRNHPDDDAAEEESHDGHGDLVRHRDVRGCFPEGEAGKDDEGHDECGERPEHLRSFDTRIWHIHEELSVGDWSVVSIALNTFKVNRRELWKRDLGLPNQFEHVDELIEWDEGLGVSGALAEDDGALKCFFATHDEHVGRVHGLYKPHLLGE